MYQQSLYLLSVLVPQKCEAVYAGAITPIRAIGVSIFLFVGVSSFSQSKVNTFLKPADSLNSNRFNTVLITEASAMTIGLIGLHQLWYKDYEQSTFHTINDNDEWMQMDKIGHFYSTYHLSRFTSEAFTWAGSTQKQKLLYGASASLGFLTTIEIFDGFSSEWGFSWSDMAANVSGTGLYVAQDLLWNEQRITPKFSFHTTKYASQNPDKLGASFSEQILKDYNGQTYWLSINLHSFAKQSKIPKWLNIAVGYGADGMLFGKNQEAVENSVFQNPKRQFYLSLDVDLTKIETQSHFLKTIFSVFNTLKIPAPTLQLTENGSVKSYLFYF